MTETHVWIEQPQQSAGQLTLSAVIELPGKRREVLWYRVPLEYEPMLTKGHDPFVLGTLFTAMREASDLVIHGEVSPSLLRNLEEFQAAWACWKPDQYTKIEIRAEQEREQPLAGGTPLAISAFSGGVDGCFTVWRHRTGHRRRGQRELEAGLLVHGFDIPLEQTEVFDRAAANAQRMLESLGVKLLRMATNFKQLKQDWEDVFGIGIASCLMFFQGRYAEGLIGSSEPYSSLVLPWGSNPVTDGLLSSLTFGVVHDGAAYTRTDKVREICAWPEALRDLRVCWQGGRLDRNCGRCEKCIRTVLNFWAIGQPRPACMPYDVTDRQIKAITGLNAPQAGELEQILEVAHSAGVRDSWVEVLAKTVWRNRRALKRGVTPWLRIKWRLKRMLRPVKP